MLSCRLQHRENLDCPPPRHARAPNRVTESTAFRAEQQAMTDWSVPQIRPLRARRTSAAGDLYRRNRHGWADTAGGSPAWLLTAQAIPQTFRAAGGAATTRISRRMATSPACAGPSWRPARWDAARASCNKRFTTPVELSVSAEKHRWAGAAAHVLSHRGTRCCAEACQCSPVLVVPVDP